MSKVLTSACALALALCGSATSAQSEEGADPAGAPSEALTAPQAFANWMVSCDADHLCRMSQSIVQPATGRLVLQVKVFAGPDPTLLVSFPLGILLSPGWRYRIDGRTEVVLPFEICDPNGCHAGVKLTPDLIEAMKRGNQMQIRFFDAGRQPVEPVLSLAGFTKAWGALQ